jgi:hypothetical protein
MVYHDWEVFPPSGRKFCSLWQELLPKDLALLGHVYHVCSYASALYYACELQAVILVRFANGDPSMVISCSLAVAV